eukprot:CAMPEP_0115155672 /NCGR_PEP_ID=MMETSP0227-20121206/68025_1 /TAXON_ID=89957 /ORGANISM="Polarella glacialis, Strain CCMP 1383" /LENGTH=355 /DNA_ID=CAMNT_0002566775 /DNA_START=15 /DNA_END=1082 /DNA_ORIENTATION=+
MSAVFPGSTSDPDVSLIERYSVPENRVLGVSTIMGRAGVAVSKELAKKVSRVDLSLSTSVISEGLASVGSLSLAELRRITLPPHGSSGASRQLSSNLLSASDPGTAEETAEAAGENHKASRRRRNRKRLARASSDSALTRGGPGAAAKVQSQRPVSAIGREDQPEVDRDLMTGGHTDIENSCLDIGGPTPPEKRLPTSSPKPANQKPSTSSPFVEFEDREQRMIMERRWLLEDASYMAARTRGLQHTAALARRKEEASGAGTEESEQSSAAVLPRLNDKKLKKQQQAAAAAQPQGQRKADRTGDLACVKSLKSLQKLLKELAQQAEPARQASRSPSPPELQSFVSMGKKPTVAEV